MSQPSAWTTKNAERLRSIANGECLHLKNVFVTDGEGQDGDTKTAPCWCCACGWKRDIEVVWLFGAWRAK